LNNKAIHQEYSAKHASALIAKKKFYFPSRMRGERFRIFFQHQPGSQAKRDGGLGNKHTPWFSAPRNVPRHPPPAAPFAERVKFSVCGHMELEGIAAARDLLYDPIPLNGLMRAREPPPAAPAARDA
jgi:hypothetical protein